MKRLSSSPYLIQNRANATVRLPGARVSEGIREWIQNSKVRTKKRQTTMTMMRGQRQRQGYYSYKIIFLRICIAATAITKIGVTNAFHHQVAAPSPAPTAQQQQRQIQLHHRQRQQLLQQPYMTLPSTPTTHPYVGAPFNNYYMQSMLAIGIVLCYALYAIVITNVISKLEQ